MAYRDYDDDWESPVNDDEPQEDETAEGLGMGEIQIEDADSEY